MLFSSRIVGTAVTLGLTVHVAKSVGELEGFLQQSTPACVILDLHTTSLNIDKVATDIAAITSRPTLVGYGSHVDAATLKKARDAGCDVVWPRSKFMEELANALPTWFGASEKTP